MADPTSSSGHPRLVLASASPRRGEILCTLGARFESRPAGVDETPLDGESAEALVLRLAAAKARGADAPADAIVLAADTAVELDGVIFGKPDGEADALAMLARLSGRTHRVLTGVAVASAAGIATALSVTRVRFREIAADEARRYWATGEPAGKAGAYAIQGYGGLFVASIMGSYSGVVGLPVFETAELLRDAGLDLLPRAPSPVVP